MFRVKVHHRLARPRSRRLVKYLFVHVITYEGSITPQKSLEIPIRNQNSGTPEPKFPLKIEKHHRPGEIDEETAEPGQKYTKAGFDIFSSARCGDSESSCLTLPE